MRVLLTWSDRAPAPRGVRRARRPGPSLALDGAQALGPWDMAAVLCLGEDSIPAGALASDLRAVAPTAQVLPLTAGGLGEPGVLLRAAALALEALPRRADLEVLLDPGPPEARTLWLMLAAGGWLERGGRVRLWGRAASGWQEVKVEPPPSRAERPRPPERPTEALVGESLGATRLRRELASLAPSAVPVWVSGPPGVGKHHVARLLHRLGPRAEGPMQFCSAAAWTPEALRVQLLGGAGTAGLVEQARGGTLVLDRAERLRPEHLEALCGVSAPGTRLVLLGGEDGGGEPTWEGGRLRVPALAERLTDLEPLVAHFLGELHRPALRLRAQTWAALRAWRWPGNVQELRGEVVRWVVLCRDEVGVEDLSAPLRLA